MLRQLAQRVDLGDFVTLRPMFGQSMRRTSWPHNPPVRRKSVPDSWLELTIREGKIVRCGATARVGLPTLRLIRYGSAIGNSMACSQGSCAASMALFRRCKNDRPGTAAGAAADRQETEVSVDGYAD